MIRTTLGLGEHEEDLHKNTWTSGGSCDLGGGGYENIYRDQEHEEDLLRDWAHEENLHRNWLYKESFMGTLKYEQNLHREQGT